MYCLTKKRQSRAYESQLLSIHIVRQLKDSKGLVLFRKLALDILPVFYNQKNVLRSNVDEPIQLILILGGRINYEKKQGENQQVKLKNQYLILDKTIKYAEAGQPNTQVLSLSQKEMYFFFEDILSFPHLTQKLKTLRKNQIFSQMTRKQLIKIATSLQEVTVFIGSIVYTEKSMCQLIYYLVEGCVLLTKNQKQISLLNKHQFFGDYQMLDGESARYEETAKVVSDKAVIYKIDKNLLNSQQLFNSKKLIQKRQWRQYRMHTITNAIKPQKKSTKKTQISFVQKQDLLQSFYRDSHKKLSSQAIEFFKSLPKKYLSQQQFYEERLDTLKKIRFKKFGPAPKNIVLFPFDQKKCKRKKTLQNNFKFSHGKTFSIYS